MDLADPTIHLIGYFGGFKKRKTITDCLWSYVSFVQKLQSEQLHEDGMDPLAFGAGVAPHPPNLVCGNREENPTTSY